MGDLQEHARHVFITKTVPKKMKEPSYKKKKGRMNQVTRKKKVQEKREEEEEEDEDLMDGNFQKCGNPPGPLVAPSSVLEVCFNLVAPSSVLEVCFNLVAPSPFWRRASTPCTLLRFGGV